MGNIAGTFIVQLPSAKELFTLCLGSAFKRTQDPKNLLKGVSLSPNESTFRYGRAFEALRGCWFCVIQ
jgi:hypothetical protein